jgi:hypothetical protein
MRLLVLLALAGCAVPDATATRMELHTEDGLGASDVGSVVVLVLGGSRASCARALEPASPLDDPELEVVRHALFTVDGSAKHLSIPAGQRLVFYAEAYRSDDGSGARVGRGCSEATIAPGESGGVSIALSASR